ncbi:MAG TPA: PD-(D/E)XK nuclease family protein [Candidatus Binatia bacterium]|jgi:ATP-dependent helicase/nuclease subunit B
MEIILGPFHPFLEDALVEETLRHKNEAPLSPLLILVPSDSLRRRLKVLLARERGLNLLNLHLLTFYQLSLRLWEERHGAELPPLQDNSLLEEILRQIIRARLPGAAPFAGLDQKAGGAAALWQTLRDLKDGTVDPAVALEAARGDLFEEATEGVEKLFILFQTFLACSEEWNLRDYADLDAMAREQAPQSAYLKRFENIFYYGFYDLTQVQLDLFQSIARQYPVTLFFPLVYGRPKHPAWTFAERFYERYVHGLADGGSEIRNLTASERDARHVSHFLFTEGADRPRPTIDGFPVKVASCFSGREEIDAAAKEILRLVADEKFSFDQIGVVGRTLDPYLPWIKEIFAEHSIPIGTSAEEPLVGHPLAKAALLLVNLRLKGYLRSQVIDLFDSPFFDRSRSHRTDLWDLATRRLGIGKGIEEWRRLEKYLARDIFLAEDREDDGARKNPAVPAEQVRTLWRLFAELSGDLESLPEEAAWSGYVESWKNLQKKWLSVDWTQSSSGLEAAELIDKTLDRLSVLDAVNDKVSLSHFLETYQHWLERAVLPVAESNARGVAVLDAMAARGISFRALFIVGLNEGIFPRTIREDAFLRDRERELLETVLGYKVATKLGGFDEERLLFTLLVGAAGEKLYCLYQRNDESGRPLARSWYLDELERAVGQEKLRTLAVPRGVVEKSKLEPFSRNEFVPPGELAIRLVLAAEDPMPLLHLSLRGLRGLPSPTLYARGSEVIRRLETITAGLGEHDGVVGPLADYWKRVAGEGLSPTALEAYARCPFQFFARNLLGLERLERPEDVAGPGAADEGQIVHAILRSFYQELTDHNFFSNKTSIDATAILQAVSEKIFREFAENNPVGYPLAWQIRKELVAALLEQTVARDLEELQASGYVPWALECDAAVRLPESWPAPLGGLTFRGRMDRIDYQPVENRYRVVDYKLKSAKARHAADRDLLRSALRGLRLQLPFYLLLGRQQAEASGRAAASIDAAFYFLAPEWPEGPLVVESLRGDVWDGVSGAALKETVAFLADSIRRGFFFIQPADHCRYCEVSEACRRNHRPTLWRGERDPRSKTHLNLKKAEINDD